MVHIYCGDGKGKTTAAVGLSVRAAGRGNQVIFTQFFKNGSSGEVKMLQKMEHVQTIHCDTVPGRFSNMTEEQRQQACRDYTTLLEMVLQMSKNARLLVLDEAISACNRGVIPEERLVAFLKEEHEDLEVVLTGRNPSENLLACADYVTEMKKIRHPYDKGVKARKGIEF